LTLPAVPRHEANVLDSERVSQYLDAARAHGLYGLLMFAAASGCRRGEALALPWPDVDLDRGAVKISKSLEQTEAGLRVKSTKTERTRTISLPASLVELLKFHREVQGESRRLFGCDYRTDLDLVFCDPMGNYLKPDTVTAKACLIARKAGLGKGTSLHTRRHSHASQLLSNGVSLATVSKRLGHTDVHTTATIYSHALPKDDLSAAESWDANFTKTKADAAARSAKTS
jgi:integrase